MALTSGIILAASILPFAGPRKRPIVAAGGNAAARVDGSIGNGGMMGSSLEQLAARIGAAWAHSPYYESDEIPAHIAPFWAKDTIFRKYFDQLDITNIVELACGHGRHTAQIVDRIGAAILTDINETNIAFCRQRFAGRDNIQCYVSNGIDLQPVPDGWATAVFSYDAMVHFEPDVVMSYVRDCPRALKVGGRALFHVSNYSSNPGNLTPSPHGRNFMDRKLFEHVAISSGLRIVDAIVIPWGSSPDHDGVFLLERTY